MAAAVAIASTLLKRWCILISPFNFTAHTHHNCLSARTCGNVQPPANGLRPSPSQKRVGAFFSCHMKGGSKLVGETVNSGKITPALGECDKSRTKTRVARLFRARIW